MKSKKIQDSSSIRRFRRLNDEKSQNTPNADYFKKNELLGKIKVLLDYKPIFKNKIEELLFTFKECDLEPSTIFHLLLIQKNLSKKY